MGLLKTLGTGQGYLKAGFLGFPKSGKSWTSMLLATGLKRHLKLEGPIVMFDTEGGSEYLAPVVRAEGCGELVGLRSRSFSDLMEAARECVSIGGSVFIVDSITHPWRELCDAHLKAINDVRRAKGQAPRSRLEFADWNNIKTKWAVWTEWYLNSAMHVSIAGRAGYEYDFEEREDGSGKDLVKTGVKMKTEGEFGFEPSLLVMMERRQSVEAGGRITHHATVIGDRYGVMDGAERDNPDFSFFLPHVSSLSPGAHAPIDTNVKTDMQVDESGDAEWVRARRERKILCEEIEGELLRAWPGQTAAEKKAKASAIERAFGTRSWTAVESMDAETLRAGLDMLRMEAADASEAAAAGKETA